MYRRFARWQEKGIWAALIDHLAADADREWVMLDSTVVRAHACAAGAKKAQASKRLAARAAASPASCTLPPTAFGNPLAFRLTAGQQGDAPQALPLLDRLHRHTR